MGGGYAQVSGYSYAVEPCTEGACENQNLKGFAAALESTPVSVCVNAGVWNDYTGGVLKSAACGSSGAMSQDHCVMATGFNTTAPTPYWIVRNSWASTWGEEGYIYLEMKKNTCGLADDVTIPHVKLDMSDEEEAEAARLMSQQSFSERRSALMSDWAAVSLDQGTALVLISGSALCVHSFDREHKATCVSTLLMSHGNACTGARCIAVFLDNLSKSYWSTRSLVRLPYNIALPAAWASGRKLVTLISVNRTFSSLKK